MSDELKKKVARLFCDTAAGQCGDDFFCEQCLGGADAAIALALEEAARVAEKTFGEGYHVAAAIRALKDKP